MHALLRFSDGIQVEGVLLAVGPGRLRLAIRNQIDTVELRVEGGVLVAEDGRTMEWDAMVALEGCGIPVIRDSILQRILIRAAGATED